jgi:hypothetical protein
MDGHVLCAILGAGDGMLFLLTSAWENWMLTRENTVPLDQLALLARQPGYMEDVACKRDVGTFQMVSPRAIGLLVPTNPRYSPRKTPQGP